MSRNLKDRVKNYLKHEWPFWVFMILVYALIFGFLGPKSFGWDLRDQYIYDNLMADKSHNDGNFGNYNYAPGYNIYYRDPWVPLRHRGYGLFRPRGFYYQRYNYGGYAQPFVPGPYGNMGYPVK